MANSVLRIIICLLAAVRFSSGVRTAKGHRAGKAKGHLLHELEQMPPERPRVVVSLTTFPIGDRMDVVGRTLSSLQKQSLTPDRVIINFPDRVERLGGELLSVPNVTKDWLDEYSWLFIHRTKDYGPATKLLGALEVEKDQDTIIVVVDDDVEYHSETVSTLVHEIVTNPNDVAPCFQCEVVQSIDNFRWNYAEKAGPCTGFADGYAGFAVRPRYFDERVWAIAYDRKSDDRNLAPPGCRLHDDVWISGSMLNAAKVRPYVVKPGFFSVLQHGISGKKDFTWQPESVFVATKKALGKGQDPEAHCVAYFSFSDGQVWLDDCY